MEKLLGGNLRALLRKELSEEAKFSLKFVAGVKPSQGETAAKAGALMGWDDCSSLGLFPGWKIRNQTLPNPFFLQDRDPLRATSTTSQLQWSLAVRETLSAVPGVSTAGLAPTFRNLSRTSLHTWCSFTGVPWALWSPLFR